MFAWSTCNALQVGIRVYYEPIVENFNVSTMNYSVSSMDDIDTSQVFDEYLRRFQDAWLELAEK